MDTSSINYLIYGLISIITWSNNILKIETQTSCSSPLTHRDWNLIDKTQEPAPMHRTFPHLKRFICSRIITEGHILSFFRAGGGGAQYLQWFLYPIFYYFYKENYYKKGSQNTTQKMFSIKSCNLFLISTPS